MRYLLLPITFVLWYFSAYYSLYLSMLGIAYIFSLSWLWILFGYLFLIMLLGGLAVGIPGVLRYFISKLYGFNRFIGGIHSVAGVLGIVWFLIYHIHNPPQVVLGDERIFMLYGMWALSPLKTIVLVMPFLGVIIGAVWSCVFAPVLVPKELID